MKAVKSEKKHTPTRDSHDLFEGMKQGSMGKAKIKHGMLENMLQGGYNASSTKGDNVPKSVSSRMKQGAVGKRG